jgi:hypothetical protein
VKGKRKKKRTSQTRKYRTIASPFFKKREYVNPHRDIEARKYPLKKKQEGDERRYQ